MPQTTKPLMQRPIVNAPQSTLPSGRSDACEGALVTGADYRGLGIVRSLGRQGIPVWVLKQDGQLLGAASRYACRSLACPPWEDDRKQLDFLLDLSIRDRKSTRLNSSHSSISYAVFCLKK